MRDMVISKYQKFLILLIKKYFSKPFFNTYKIRRLLQNTSLENLLAKSVEVTKNGDEKNKFFDNCSR